MNTNIVWGIVAVIIIAAGAWYFTMRSGVEVPVNTNTTATTTGSTDTPATATGAQYSLGDLTKLSGSQKCVFKQTVENSISEGVVYVSGGKIRGDFTTQASGQTMKSHMVADGTTVYSWVDGMPAGVKMPMVKMTTQTQAGAGAQALDLNQKLSYDCSPAAVNASLFVAPSTLTFIEANY